jgi:hypothetical protein
MDLFLLLVALLGHGLFWAAVLNRLHAVAMPRWMLDALSGLCLACLVLVPVAFGWWLVAAGFQVFGERRGGEIPRPAAASLLYLLLCWLLAAGNVGWWIWRALWHRAPHVLRSHRTRSVVLLPDPAAVMTEEHAHHFLVHLLRNEILRLDVTERVINVPRLPSALDGLSIVHLSDFHFTGKVGKAYFREVVRLANQLQPDLVAVTGDLVDKSRCIDWIPETLGQLRGRHGVYFVLGNHDLRVDTGRLRRVLSQSGLIDLGGRLLPLSIRGEPVVLAGNELPWLAPAADMSRCPPPSGGRPLRIVLSHSPDQLDWAVAHDVDLLLAGHTHGGQIRFPLVGAILTPSRQGVKYASGVFHAPPTIMHVTRGVSGNFPLRLNCPPEMAHLVLRAIQRP